MSKLGQLLSYLERPEVTELVFRSGAPAVMKVGNRQHPITVTPLRMPQLRRFFEGTQVLDLLPSRGELAPRAHFLELQGHPYRVVIRGNETTVEIRVSKEQAGENKPATRPSSSSAQRHPDAPEPRPVGHRVSKPTPTSRERNKTPPPRERIKTTPPRERIKTTPPARERIKTPPPRERIKTTPPARERIKTPIPRERPPIDDASVSRDRASGDDAPVPRDRGTGDRMPVSLPDGDRRGPARSRGDASRAYPARLGAPGFEIESDPSAELEIERNDDLNTSYHGGSSITDPPSGPIALDFTIERGGQEQPPRRTPRTNPNQEAVTSRMPSPTVSNAAAMPSLRPNAPSAGPMPSPGAPASTVRLDVAARLSGPRVEAQPHTPIHTGLRQILVSARQLGTSDVHIMSDAPVRLRRAGALEPIGAEIPGDQVKAMVEPLLMPRHAAQLESRGYADLGADVPGIGRLRINVNRQRTGLKICIRLVVNDPPSVEALGLPPEIRKLTTHHQGMVLISGPNGHGKTTTMAAIVDLFNAGKPLHIITVEDPVEVIHPRKRALMTQREVGTHTLSFAAALAGALREDPDVIAIGELRDRETVEMALSAAETGHLVLATMSTPSGAKTIDRVIDMFPPDDQSQVRATLSGALKLVISQRLLRRADGSGLVAAYEMITGNVPLWTLIRDNKLFQLPSLLQRGRNYGMIRLEDSLRELMSQGVVTEEEALLYAEDPRALAPPAAAETPREGGGLERGGESGDEVAATAGLGA